MTVQEWLALGQFVIMAVAGGFVWILGRENANRARWERDIEDRLDDLDMETLRRIFMTNERYNDLHRVRRGFPADVGGTVDES